MEDALGRDWQRFCDVSRTPTTLSLDYRLLLGRYSGTDKLEITTRRLTPDKSGKPCNCPLPAEQRCSSGSQAAIEQISVTDVPLIPEYNLNPFLWRLQNKVDTAGKGCVEVTTKLAGEVITHDAIPIEARVNANEQRFADRRTQRLVVALNRTPVASPADWTADDPPSSAQVIRILDRIYQRLTSGLAGAWRSYDGGRGLPVDQMHLDERALAEERWARGITEMLCCVPYYTPMELYGVGSDTPVFNKFESDRGYPVSAECQQLCTLAVLSRGFRLADINGGIDAGMGTSRMSFFRRWRGEDARSPNGALAGSDPVGPGSVYLCCYPQRDRGNPHVAFVLRTHMLGWNGIQIFDTGGMAHPRRKNNVVERLGVNIYDDPWVVDDETLPGSDPYRGVGVLPEAPDLANQAARLETSAYPLGFARLVLRRPGSRGNQGVYFATPLLRMHTNVASFPISRFLWSLRELPCRERIQAVWEISAPRGRFAQALFQAGRGSTLPEILAASRMQDALAHPEREIVPPGSGEAFHLWRSVVDLRVAADGHAYCVDRIHSRDTRHPDAQGPRAESLPWGRPSGACAGADHGIAYFV